MDITPFIRELLFGHDCVIIPDFGGFIGNYTPAQIDKTTGMFSPPVKQISFNRNLRNNDGLLTGKVSESLKMNYGDARNIIELFADEVKTKLNRGEKVIFDHIGTFVNNHEGNTQFEPDPEANYNLSSYGLSSFQVTPLEGFDVRKRIIQGAEKEGRANPDFRKYLWRAAVIIPLLGVMVAVPFSTNLFKNKVQTTSLNPLASVEFENSRKAIENKKVEVPVITVNKSDSAIRTPVQPVKNNDVTPAEKNIYCIVAGSFKSEANAEALLKKLSDEGYTPEIVSAANGFYRVIALKCATSGEAVQKMDSIGKKHTGSWITKIN